MAAHPIIELILLFHSLLAFYQGVYQRTITKSKKIQWLAYSSRSQVPFVHILRDKQNSFFILHENAKLRIFCLLVQSLLCPRGERTYHASWDLNPSPLSQQTDPLPIHPPCAGVVAQVVAHRTTDREVPSLIPTGLFYLLFSFLYLPNIGESLNRSIMAMQHCWFSSLQQNVGLALQLEVEASLIRTELTKNIHTPRPLLLCSTFAIRALD